MNIIGKTVFAVDLNTFDEESSKSSFLTHAKNVFNIQMTDPVVLLISESFYD